jgi:hypothetical protein
MRNLGRPEWLGKIARAIEVQNCRYGVFDTKALDLGIRKI